MTRSIIEPISKVEAKKDLKRQRILDAAKRRFGRYGLRATTMQEIALEAGVAVGTIYQFFPDKDALMLAWVDEHRELIRSQWDEVVKQRGSADEKLRQFVRVRFHTVRAVREESAISELTRLVIRIAPKSITEMTQSALGYIRAILDEGLRSGCFPSVLPAKDAEIFFHALSGFFPSSEDPLTGPPREDLMLRVVDWFISKWKLPRPKSRS
ncbi:MAG TPA: TetR/AcrR family transcriptional regulator [Chthoniobacteraceae bacterium]|jgi:TetR/AcrR family fatty acid metabolism transcriptional regulator|nr:TetR/AcrR family transcriptional regulator [Chthoniobacteraceae bacterium]